MTIFLNIEIYIFYSESSGNIFLENDGTFRLTYKMPYLSERRT
jgi:hypothetical protein